MKDVRLILTTERGCVGTRLLREAQELAWDVRPDDWDFTESAAFTLLEDGRAIDTYTLDGDQWRALDSCYYPDQLVDFLDDGHAFRLTILAMVAGVDPDDARDCADDARDCDLVALRAENERLKRLLAQAAEMLWPILREASHTLTLKEEIRKELAN